MRPPHQAAQVILRMSEEQRAVIHAAAADAGLSTVRYLLDLAARDAARRASVDAGVLVGMFASDAESPGPDQDRDSHAKARRAVAAAAG